MDIFRAPTMQKSVYQQLDKQIAIHLLLFSPTIMHLLQSTHDLEALIPQRMHAVGRNV